MTFEQWLKANGFGDEASLSEAQRKPLLAAWKADVAPPPPAAPNPGDPEEDRRRVIDAARQRDELAKAITGMIEAALNDRRISTDDAERISLKAAAEKWDRQRVELEILRCERPRAPGLAAQKEQLPADQVIEAAVCRAGGLSGLEKMFPEQVLEAAEKQWRHGLHLGELMLTYARRNGYSGLSVKADTRAVLKAAFAAPVPEVRASGSWGPSTGGGLSGVLSNVANKFLRAGFDSVENTWRQFAAIRSVNDFKQISSYSMTGGLTYEKLPPGGEIKHGQVAAESYTNQIDTYARMLGLDRRDLINDDLGALSGTSRRLGRGGALKINDVVYSVFLNNSSFFTAGRGNVSTGAGSALAIAGLDAAYQKFVVQTDPDGNPLGATPRILLVPPALYATATQLMSSTLLTIGSGTAAAGSTNPWAGMFRVVTSPYLQNANYTGYSAAAWYLLADAADLPVIEIAFLNGQEAPTVETADADFGMLGIAFRGYHDFGAALQEYRGGVRSAGS
jgi:hypothetical protein